MKKKKKTFFYQSRKTPFHLKHFYFFQNTKTKKEKKTKNWKNILSFYLTSISVRKHERHEICSIYLLTTVKLFTSSSFNLANQNETIYCKVNWYKTRFEIICYYQNLNNLFGYIFKIWFLTKIQLFLNNFVWSKTILLMFFFF